MLFLEQALGARGHLVLVAGEAGIRKSLLADEFALCATGRCGSGLVGPSRGGLFRGLPLGRRAPRDPR
jgi:hypothetical protein